MKTQTIGVEVEMNNITRRYEKRGVRIATTFVQNMTITGGTKMKQTTLMIKEGESK